MDTAPARSVIKKRGPVPGPGPVQDQARPSKEDKSSKGGQEKQRRTREAKEDKRSKGGQEKQRRTREAKEDKRSKGGQE